MMVTRVKKDIAPPPQGTPLDTYMTEKFASFGSLVADEIASLATVWRVHVIFHLRPTDKPWVAMMVSWIVCTPGCVIILATHGCEIIGM